MLDKSLKEINELLKSKKIKPIDLVNEAFDSIEKNSDLNAYITLNKEEAIKTAKELEDVEADNDVRRLVHNMMELYEGTTIMNIVVECQKEYQERYFSMKTNDWRHLLLDYVRKVTERPELQEDEVFRYVMAG